MWSKGNDDFKTRHGITCTSCYFPESVSYRAMGRSILTLHYILLIVFIHLILSHDNNTPLVGWQENTKLVRSLLSQNTKLLQFPLVERKCFSQLKQLPRKILLLHRYALRIPYFIQIIPLLSLSQFCLV